MKIELLYFEGCPGFEGARNVVERVVAEAGLPAEVEMVRLDPGDHPGFPGSPTVLVDGEDLFPPKGRLNLARAQNCRVYPTPEGLKSHPTEELVREALAERRNQRPALRGEGG